MLAELDGVCEEPPPGFPPPGWPSAAERGLAERLTNCRLLRYEVITPFIVAAYRWRICWFVSRRASHPARFSLLLVNFSLVFILL